MADTKEPQRFTTKHPLEKLWANHPNSPQSLTPNSEVHTINNDTTRYDFHPGDAAENFRLTYDLYICMEKQVMRHFVRPSIIEDETTYYCDRYFEVTKEWIKGVILEANMDGGTSYHKGGSDALEEAYLCAIAWATPIEISEIPDITRAQE